MNATDFDAVAYDAAIYCVDCLPEGVDVAGKDVSPVFADSEWDHYPVCDTCHAEHDYVNLTTDGQVWKQTRNWNQEMRDAYEEHKHHFPAFTSLGGYTLLYVEKDGSDICAKCANDRDLELSLVDCGLYDEGPTLQCAECNDDIESSYGDPEDEEKTESDPA